MQYHHHDGSGSLNQVIQKVAKDYPHIRCNVALVHSSLVKTVEQYLLQKGGIVVPTFEGSTHVQYLEGTCHVCVYTCSTCFMWDPCTMYCMFNVQLYHMYSMYHNNDVM